MKLLTALKTLQNAGAPVMSTRDIACLLGVSNEMASQMLRRLAQEKHIVHLARSLWVLDLKVNPLLLPGYLVAPFPCYVSLQTALYLHDMIDQIPRIITVVSPARTRTIQTPLATIYVHHVEPEFFFGFDFDLKTGVKMATPEKALLDIYYLKKRLPELELPKSFNFKKAFAMIRKIPSQARRTILEKALKTIMTTQI
ncbi:MAG: hypothetical protein ABSA17_02800 [Rhabdochlamydiaceae bacterium]|jgi:predicted transcriptional regulator of viral defense system